MAQGLKPHRHICWISDSKVYHDHKRRCMVKKITFSCYVPNCKYSYTEKYEYPEQPAKEKNKDKVLERNRKRAGNQ